MTKDQQENKLLKVSQYCKRQSLHVAVQYHIDRQIVRTAYISNKRYNLSHAILGRSLKCNATNPLILIDQQDKKSLKDLAKENPTQLGDPVSLKAETSDNQPTENDVPNKDSNAARTTEKMPKDKMKEDNPSQLGDAVSLKTETSDSEPTEQDRGSLGTGKDRGNGKPKM